MASIQSEIVIAAPVERIFDFIVKDPTRLVDIWPNLDGIWNVKSLPDGRKGKTFNLAYKMAGRKVEAESETILCLTNQRNVNRTRGGVESTTSWDFEEVEGGTRVLFHSDYTVPVPLIGGLLARFLAPKNLSSAETLLRNLKAHMESAD